MSWIACINGASPQPVAVLEKIFGAWTAQGIAAAAELKVADAMADGPLTIDELAVRLGADADALARLRVSSSFLG